WSQRPHRDRHRRDRRHADGHDPRCLLHPAVLRSGSARRSGWAEISPRAHACASRRTGMKRAATLLALLASACSMEPTYVRPNPAIPVSWPIGDPYLAQAEAGLPVLTYHQVFEDPRLQALIAQALVNNRDLMVAAADIAAAREQYHIQRAQLLPMLNAGAGVTVSGDTNGGTKADYNAGLKLP